MQGSLQMQDMKRWQIPVFGHWGYCDEMSITPSFESARLFPTSFSGEVDVFGDPVPVPVKFLHPHDVHYGRKVRKGNGFGVEKHYSKEQQLRKQGMVYVTALSPPRKSRAPMAVDEDLYKIPPELLYQKPKTKSLLRKLLIGCMGFNCIR